MTEENCTDPLCPYCSGDSSFIDAVNQLCSSVLVTVLTIDRQMDKIQQVKEVVGPDIQRWIIDNADWVQENDSDVVMARLATFTKDRIEQAVGYQA